MKLLGYILRERITEGSSSDLSELLQQEEENMLKCFYIVEKIDGDYAMLRRTDETDPTAEPKMVARALLPPEIQEGSRLLYENLQYSIVEQI